MEIDGLTQSLEDGKQLLDDAKKVAETNGKLDPAMLQSFQAKFADFFVDMLSSMFEGTQFGGYLENFFDFLDPIEETVTLNNALQELENIKEAKGPEFAERRAELEGQIKDIKNAMELRPEAEALGDKLHNMMMEAKENGEPPLTKDQIMAEVKDFLEANKDILPTDPETCLQNAENVLDAKLQAYGTDSMDMELFAEQILDGDHGMDAKVDDVITPRGEGEGISYGQSIKVSNIEGGLDGLKIKGDEIMATSMDENGVLHAEGFVDMKDVKLGENATVQFAHVDGDNVGVFVSPNGDGNGFYVDAAEEMNVSEWDETMKQRMQEPEPIKLDARPLPTYQPEITAEGPTLAATI